jgi:hypothetical protein
MSLLDRMTKAVGDVVDRGKKEVDQFVRIQKINSQISDIEKSMGEFESQIHQSKVKIGEMAIKMLRAGTLASPEMQSLLDQIAGIERRIVSAESEIAQKRAEIDGIKSEGKAAKTPVVPEEEVKLPPPPPPPASTNRFCPQCGAAAEAGTFCGQCGSRLASDASAMPEGSR